MRSDNSIVLHNKNSSREILYKSGSAVHTNVGSPPRKEDAYVTPNAKIDSKQARYRQVLNDRNTMLRVLNEPHKRERRFIENPSTKAYFSLAKDFKESMMTVGNEKYRSLDDIMIIPSKTGGDLRARALLQQSSELKKLERWHDKIDNNFHKREAKAEKQTNKRHQKIAEEGPGFGGRMTNAVGKSKAASFFAKSNITMRGNVFKVTHKICPKNLYEIMPRYGSRKAGHVGVRVCQFSLNGILAGLGYGLIPVTLGISKIVSNHTQVIITLSGEAITHKIAGASAKKIILHASLRGVQLEVPRLIPVAGDIINIAESAALGTAAFGIVSTTLADLLLQNVSTRYRSTLNLDDLGDSRCLAELNRRIDYLSRFLLPYGQYLLLNESDLSVRNKIKKTLKQRFKTLRSLEKKKVKSLNFYRLALMAEKVPDSRQAQIRRDCENALPETRINTHRVVKKCLATLLEKDAQLKGDTL